MIDDRFAPAVDSGAGLAPPASATGPAPCGGGRSVGRRSPRSVASFPGPARFAARLDGTTGYGRRDPLHLRGGRPVLVRL